MIDRRTLLNRSSLLAAVTALPACTPVARPGGAPAGNSLPAFYEDIEERTFRWFWDTVNRKNGLVPDRWPTPSFCSIASIGFALTAYAVGVERGWCTRAEARDLTLTTLRFLWNAPQGPQTSGTAGHKGFFYHFLDMETGHRFRQVELSSVDTCLLLMGVLFTGRYYDRHDESEAEIRSRAQAIYARADWNFFRSDGRKPVSMGWHPETGLIPANWTGMNEGMCVYVLGLGAPQHPLPADSWQVWTSSYPKSWRGEGPTRHLAFAPMFGHQYSQIWIDFRGIQDATMREAGFDYFENSRRSTYANRAYCAANPQRWDGWSKDVWGITACDGPGDHRLPFKGETREFFGYAARGPLGQPDERDDGTLAPTAALGSLPFAPEIVIPCAQALRREHGDRLYGKYGFFDSFNPSFKYTDVQPEKGSVDPVKGWVDDDYLGIDQGPILLQAANYRNDFVWRHMHGEPAIRRGLKMAGFVGGWLG
ncbi:glucoamylase family protein [Sphingomonas sp. HF-S4]|uniref:Glucoamylase family protein n=1 Tax=Sphingomonas agrestis TaxID=3080540 RepID=A0ABU3Y353_9SPHN|nr:glucoamylase family protein [Sphingomonas sp. HF-S4]MDV3455648.1 glucoamylase family protein [Sphingomonas sp. HF-S4]